MSWPSLDELVTGRIERSYLRRDGWWARLVLDSFAFLEPLGYSLTGSDLAGIYFHQKGNYIRFHGPGPDVVVEYDPDSRYVDAALWGDGARVPLDQAILSLDPQSTSIPSKEPFDKRHADELLALGGRPRVTLPNAD